MLLNDVINEFTTYLRAMGRTTRTVLEYRRRLLYLESLTPRLELITPAMLDEQIGGFYARWSKATVAGYIQAIRTFFTWCINRGYLSRSPGAHLKRVKWRSKAKAIPQADLDHMIEYARTTPGKKLEYAILMFLADTGCRVGELMSLNLSDLDLSACEATCRGKTGERILDYTPPTREALESWLAVRPKTDPLAVFTTRTGRITHISIYRRLEAIARNVGAHTFNPHSIRHRVGQGWIDHGANLEIVRLKLGHHEISTTSIFYSHQDRPRIKHSSLRYTIIHNTRTHARI